MLLASCSLLHASPSPNERGWNFQSIYDAPVGGVTPKKNSAYFMTHHGPGGVYTLTGVQGGNVSDTTKRIQAERKTSEKPPPPTSSHELQLRIPCGGRSSEQVLEDVSRGLTDALAKERDPLLVLEDLGRLQGSITTLIKGLSRLVYKYPRPVTCWESSGLTEAFLSIMEAAENTRPPT